MKLIKIDKSQLYSYNQMMEAIRKDKERGDNLYTEYKSLINDRYCAQHLIKTKNGDFLLVKDDDRKEYWTEDDRYSYGIDISSPGGVQTIVNKITFEKCNVIFTANFPDIEIIDYDNLTVYLV